jgi:hypothetical protein
MDRMKFASFEACVSAMKVIGNLRMEEDVRTRGNTRTRAGMQRWASTRMQARG